MFFPSKEMGTHFFLAFRVATSLGDQLYFFHYDQVICFVANAVLEHFQASHMGFIDLMGSDPVFFILLCYIVGAEGFID